MKWFFAILCLFLAAVSFGVRIHPESAAARFQRETFENYYEIEFFSGQKLAGRLVSESAESFEITIGSGTAVFKKNEIKSRRLLDAEAVKAGQYSDLILRKKNQSSPVITLRYEDSLFYTAEQRLDAVISNAAAKLGKENVLVNPRRSPAAKRSAETKIETGLPENLGSPSAGSPSSETHGFSSGNNQDQDYAALIKAGLEQLRNSAK